MAYQSQSRSITIGVRELEALAAKVLNASREDTEVLLEAVGEQQVAAAKRRINETKTAPDGKKWAPWSKAYARTRGPQHSLLVDEHNLSDTMTYNLVGHDAVEVGSPMSYAGALLFGPHARPFLDVEPGFADPRDRDELRGILREFMEGFTK